MEFIIGQPIRRSGRSRRAAAIHIFDDDGEEVIDLSASPVPLPRNRNMDDQFEGSFEVDDDDDGNYADMLIGAVTANNSGNSSVSVDSRFEFDTTPNSSDRQIANNQTSTFQPADEMDADDDEEEQVKRACMETMPSSSQANSTITDDSVMCPICFDAWTSDGPHRIISLKCGHVFGLSCIEKWMLTTKKCPTCQQTVRKTDIRNLFVRCLKALDTSERNALNKKIAEREEEVRQMILKLALVNMTVTSVKQDAEKWQQETERLKKELHQRDEQLLAFRTQGRSTININNINQINVTSVNQTAARSSSFQASSRRSAGSPSASSFQMIKKVEVCNTGGCRVMASCQDMETIAISLKNPNSLFPGYGVRRISTHDYDLSEFIPIHSEVITDMCFKPNDPLLLTASMDKTVKLTSLIDKTVCKTFGLPCQARSCCWHPTNSYVCFVGLNSGDIQGFDTRNPSLPTHIFDGIAPNPLISVQFVSKGHSITGSQEESFTGLLCNNLTTCFFYEISESGDLLSQHTLPLDGKFLPAHYDQKSGYGLISIRPSKLKQTRLQHNVIQLKKHESGGISSEIVQEFHGGAASECLSKSKVFMNPFSFNSKPYVFAADEQNGGILLYDTDSRNIKQVIKNTDKIMDIGLVSSTADKMQIAALTEKGITFYDKKFTYKY